VAPATRIVIAESVDERVPDGTVPTYQHSLPKVYPYGIKYEPPRGEILNVEVGGLHD
jgi:hypothetical protein